MPVGKVGNAETLTSELVERLVPELAQLTFGQLLTWLLRHWGARPLGHRELWSNQKFAFEVGSNDATGHTVGNWRRDQNFPADTAAIERALFGDNKLYDPWRVVLRNALAAARKKGNLLPARRKRPLHLKRPFFGVPPRIASFTGREHELAALHTALTKDHRAVVTVGRAAASGMGGVGKTALAIEYAHRYRESYAATWWCPAETQEGLLTALAELANWAGVQSPGHSNMRSHAMAALQWLALPRRRKWLLIYDNVQEPHRIAEFLPVTGARVLITSRFPSWTEWGTEATVDIFSVDQAVDYLQLRAKRNDPTGARLLADALGCLPLALDHAAAICFSSQLSFAAFANAAATLIVQNPRGTNYPRSVFATFDLSLNEAILRCPYAENLMAFLAHCAPERIPTYLVEVAFEDDISHQQALSALAELSLIKPDPFPDGTPAFTVHRLVQLAARIRSQRNSTASGAISRLFATLRLIYPESGIPMGPLNNHNYKRCTELTPHVITLRSSSDFTDLPPELFLHAVNFLLSFQPFEAPMTGDQADLLRSVLEVSTKALLSATKYTAYRYSDVAALLERRGQLEAARQCSAHLISILERINDPSLYLYLGWHAGVLELLGDFAGARIHWERKLAICELAFGPSHLNTAHAHLQLGSVCTRLDELSTARRHLERARSLYTALDHGDIFMSDVLPALAETLVLQRYVQDAVDVYREAIRCKRKERVHGEPKDHIARYVVEISRAAVPAFQKAEEMSSAEAVSLLQYFSQIIAEQMDPCQLEKVCGYELQETRRILGGNDPRTRNDENTYKLLLASHPRQST